MVRLWFFGFIGILVVSSFAKNESVQFWKDNKSFYLIETRADAQCKLQHLKNEVFSGTLKINKCANNKCDASMEALYNLDVYGKCLSSPNHDVVGFYFDNKTLFTYCDAIQIEQTPISKQVSFLLKDECLCLYKGISKTDLKLEQPNYEYGVMEVKKLHNEMTLRIIPKEGYESKEMGILFHSCTDKQCNITLFLNGEPKFSEDKVSIQPLCDFVHVEKKNETDVLSWGKIEADHQGICDLRIMSKFGKEKISVMIPEKISDLPRQSKLWKMH